MRGQTKVIGVYKVESGTGNWELVPGSRFDSFNGNNFFVLTPIKLKLLLMDYIKWF